MKALPIANTKQATLRQKIKDNVKVGSQLYADDHLDYTGAGGMFYKHNTVNHSAKEYVNGMTHTNGIERVWAVLKHGYIMALIIIGA